MYNKRVGLIITRQYFNCGEETVDAKKDYNEASIKTANNLKTIARSMVANNLSQLSLPEVEAVADQVARIVPAGNVPGMVLNGLARLPGRKPPPKIVKRDINLLFKGVSQTLDKAVYGAFFAGPAAIIWGYQNLLKLAGKDPEASFPEGTWQFYADYALREDTARHVNESHGFDTILNRHQIHLSQADRITAWVMAAIHTLHQYHNLLENEWRERVYTYLLHSITGQAPDANRYAGLYREWARQRPYGRGQDAEANETYPAYRRRKFDHFLKKATPDLRPDLRRQWQAGVDLAEEEILPAYQQQMSILAYLEPGPNGETRRPIPLEKACVGIIHQGRYYLIPACLAQTGQPANVESVRARIAGLLTYPPDTPPVQLAGLAKVKRAAWPGLRKKINPSLIKELDMLRLAPILLNCDPRPRRLPLAELRQAERGVGDQALTLFDTGETIVFDQSHIFFDGTWGTALAEIMTNEALAWATYLNQLSPVEPRQTRPYAPAFKLQPSELELIRQAPPVTPEVSAETEAANVKAILRLRRLFKLRNDLLQITVNDILVLYRAIHAATYRPDPDLVAELKALRPAKTTRKATSAALEAIDSSNRLNPAIVIPVDASLRSPRDRLYPITFEVPLHELDLLNLHRRVMASLEAYKGGAGDRTAYYTEFDKVQRLYLSTLAGFGAVLSQVKEIAVAGESAAVGAIKLLAYMPAPLQRMLDTVPNRSDVLNDIIKGREVFSNVGAVAPTSTLTRFITAKDDNDKKALAWGVMTDARGVMRITLRDFRPHVGLLVAAGHKDLAVRIVDDYLDAYAQGLNNFIRDLQRITETSRETRLVREFQKNNDPKRKFQRRNVTR